MIDVRELPIDPRVSFGRPTLAGSEISTEVLVQRVDAGGSVQDLAVDYGLTGDQVEEAVVYERAA